MAQPFAQLTSCVQGACGHRLGTSHPPSIVAALGHWRRVGARRNVHLEPLAVGQEGAAVRAWEAAAPRCGRHSICHWSTCTAKNGSRRQLVLRRGALRLAGRASDGVNSSPACQRLIRGALWCEHWFIAASHCIATVAAACAAQMVHGRLLRATALVHITVADRSDADAAPSRHCPLCTIPSALKTHAKLSGALPDGRRSHC